MHVHFGRLPRSSFHTSSRETSTSPSSTTPPNKYMLFALIAMAALIRPRGFGRDFGGASPLPGEYSNSLTTPPTLYSLYALRT